MQRTGAETGLSRARKKRSAGPGACADDRLANRVSPLSSLPAERVDVVDPTTTLAPPERVSSGCLMLKRPHIRHRVSPDCAAISAGESAIYRSLHSPHRHVTVSRCHASWSAALVGPGHNGSSAGHGKRPRLTSPRSVLRYGETNQHSRSTMPARSAMGRSSPGHADSKHAEDVDG